jgi:hypothetical protein
MAITLSGIAAVLMLAFLGMTAYSVVVSWTLTL